MMQPPKPSKPEKRKSKAESGQPSFKDLERAMKFMTKIIEKEEPAKEELQDVQELAEPSTELESIHIPEPKKKAQEKEEDVALLRFPSPSRSRQGSPNKRDASPK